MIPSRDEVIFRLGTSPRLAHEVLFSTRHSAESPDFHLKIIDLLHSTVAKGVIEGFRNSAKSTRAEEAVIIKAVLKRHRNILLVGASFPRAKERLGAIKNELVTNQMIEYLFGKQEGEAWMEGKIVLSNGVCVQAVGSGMSLRGTRHLNWRPDYVIIDDLEDEESVKDPEQRDKMMRWLYGTLLPALSEDHPAALVRLLGNRLDDDAVIVRVAKDPAWQHIRVPIMEQHAEGDERYDLPPGRWRATWPGMFPLEKIAEKRSEYERLGMLQTFNCEYMCEASDPEQQLFKASQERTHTGVRTWQGVFAAYDPARTVNSTSASTGKAVFSWVGNRLIVWKGDARLWLPDEIVADIFQTDQEFRPVEIGVEATGLEEFILQPLRHRALDRKQLLPIRKLKPPRGKDSFIKSLQPFFKSGEIEFVDVSSEARGQLLSFPTGRKDFPNALAYALIMKPGLPVYPEFSYGNVVDGLLRMPDPFYLVVNATNQFTTGVLLQAAGGQIRVHADWIEEGPPGEVLDGLVGAASIDCGAAVRLRVPPVGGAVHDTVGLLVAARALQLGFEYGGDILKGRQQLHILLDQQRRDEPLFAVGSAARWVLNGLAGGYARRVDGRTGAVSTEPADGPYRVLFEGLESFVARYRAIAQEEQPGRFAYTGDGQRYRTILPTGEPLAPSKEEWYKGQDVRTPLSILPRR